MAFFLGCQSFENKAQVNHSPSPQWKLIYQHDYNEKALSGTVEDLVRSVQLGNPIRVSWGGEEPDGSKWIHFAEPEFLTIMNDTSIVVQFPQSLIQTNYTNLKETFLKTSPPIGSQALMRTDGVYHQFHYDRQPIN